MNRIFTSGTPLLRSIGTPINYFPRLALTSSCVIPVFFRYTKPISVNEDFNCLPKSTMCSSKTLFSPRLHGLKSITGMFILDSSSSYEILKWNGLNSWFISRSLHLLGLSRAPNRGHWHPPITCSCSPSQCYTEFCDPPKNVTSGSAVVYLLQHARVWSVDRHDKNIFNI